MAKVRLIHWNGLEAEERGQRLEALGFKVDWKPLQGSGFLKGLRECMPDALVIDLSRLPAQGRDVGVMVRGSKPLRRLPLVFVAGSEEKVQRVRQTLPDAVFVSWQEIGPALKEALANPPADPVVPGDIMAGYSGTPLPRKLGIKEGFVVELQGAPADFEGTLGELPEGAVLSRDTSLENDLLLWFSTRLREVESQVEAMGRRAGRGGLWIIWPKKSSGVNTDLNQNLVRQAGLDVGLVDYKICAVDETWSGLKFTWRKDKKEKK